MTRKGNPMPDPTFTGKSALAHTTIPDGVEDLSDLVGIVSPYETPLLGALGDADREAVSGRPASRLVKVVVVNRRGLAARHLAVADELDFQKAKALRHLLRELEQAVVNDLVSRLTTNRCTPGERGFPSGTVLDDDKLNAALAVIWERSRGQVDLIVAGGFLARAIALLAGPHHTNQRAIYESDFGVQRVVLSRWVPRDTVLLLDSNRIQVQPLPGRRFQYQPFPASGDFEKGQVFGEYSLDVRDETAHGVIRGLATEHKEQGHDTTA